MQAMKKTSSHIKCLRELMGGANKPGDMMNTLWSS